MSFNNFCIDYIVSKVYVKVCVRVQKLTKLRLFEKKQDSRSWGCIGGWLKAIFSELRFFFFVTWWIDFLIFVRTCRYDAQSMSELIWKSSFLRIFAVDKRHEKEFKKPIVGLSS